MSAMLQTETRKWHKTRLKTLQNNAQSISRVHSKYKRYKKILVIFWRNADAPLPPNPSDGHSYLSEWTVSDETTAICALILPIPHFWRNPCPNSSPSLILGEIYALIFLIAHLGRVFSLARCLLVGSLARCLLEGSRAHDTTIGPLGLRFAPGRKTIRMIRRCGWKHTLPTLGGRKKLSKKWNTWYTGDKECCYWKVIWCYFLILTSCLWNVISFPSYQDLAFIIMIFTRM